MSNKYHHGYIWPALRRRAAGDLPKTDVPTSARLLDSRFAEVRAAS